MKEKTFKFRAKDYEAIKEMTDRQAGQFIKNLCQYAFEGIEKPTKNAKIASAFAYAKTALDETERGRHFGKQGAEALQEHKAHEKEMNELIQGIMLTVLDGASKAMEKKE